MSTSNPLVEAATEAQTLCQDRGWRFCFIGGLAVLRWGEPRLTRDVDLTIITGYGDEAQYVDVLIDHLEPRIENARAFGVDNRVVLVRATNGVPIDIALGALPFEERTVERASAFEIAGRRLTVCSAEDLIVHKVFAGRERDWLDIEGVVARHGEELDRHLIRSELEPLLRAVGNEGRLGRLEATLE